jgi:hypothetical protein
MAILRLISAGKSLNIVLSFGLAPQPVQAGSGALIVSYVLGWWFDRDFHGVTGSGDAYVDSDSHRCFILPEGPVRAGLSPLQLKSVLRHDGLAKFRLELFRCFRSQSRNTFQARIVGQPSGLPAVRHLSLGLLNLFQFILDSTDYGVNRNQEILGRAAVYSSVYQRVANLCWLKRNSIGTLEHCAYRILQPQFVDLPRKGKLGGGISEEFVSLDDLVNSGNPAVDSLLLLQQAPLFRVQFCNDLPDVHGARLYKMVKHVKKNSELDLNFLTLEVNGWDDVIAIAKGQLQQVREREIGLLRVIKMFTGFRDRGEPWPLGGPREESTNAHRQSLCQPEISATQC